MQSSLSLKVLYEYGTTILFEIEDNATKFLKRSLMINEQINKN